MDDAKESNTLVRHGHWGKRGREKTARCGLLYPRGLFRTASVSPRSWAGTASVLRMSDEPQPRKNTPNKGRRGACGMVVDTRLNIRCVQHHAA